MTNRDSLSHVIDQIILRCESFARASMESRDLFELRNNPRKNQGDQSDSEVHLYSQERFEIPCTHPVEFTFKDWQHYLGERNTLYFRNNERTYIGLSPEQCPALSKSQAIAALENSFTLFKLNPFDAINESNHVWSQWNLLGNLLPPLLISYEHGSSAITIQLTKLDSDEKEPLLKLAANWKKLSRPSPQENQRNSLSVKKVEENPNFKDWNFYMEKLLADLENNPDQVTKMVAAREVIVELEESSEAYNLFNSLSSHSQYSFFLRNESLYFMGNTPECLLKHRDHEFEFDALAGTRARGKSDAEDLALERELWESPKEQFEHLQVVDYLKEGLREYGEVTAGESHILKLKSLQHIKTPLLLKSKSKANQIGQSETLFELFEKLHPTPAVCGLPKEYAKKFILHHEPINRGLYAGAFGVIERNQSDLCVTIRSLLFSSSQKRVHLYGGAGIVKGSTAKGEWLETAEKIKSFSPLDINIDIN